MEEDRACVCKAASASVLDFRGALLPSVMGARCGVCVPGFAVESFVTSLVAPSTAMEREVVNVVALFEDSEWERISVSGRFGESNKIRGGLPRLEGVPRRDVEEEPSCMTRWMWRAGECVGPFLRTFGVLHYGQVEAGLEISTLRFDVGKLPH